MLLRRVKQTKGIKGKGIVLEYVRGEQTADKDWDRVTVNSESYISKIIRNGYIQANKLG